MSEAVEKAAASEMQDIQRELEKCTEERNAIAEVNTSRIWFVICLNSLLFNHSF